jgi:hypothetical protein
MSNILFAHKPRWRRDGDEWQMVVGNRVVAALIPQSGEPFPQYQWGSVLLDDGTGLHIEHTDWHAVDFESLEDGKRVLEQWWAHACRGEAYRP